MAQTQFTPSGMATEVLHSLGTEIAVFAITLLIAVSFRGLSFGNHQPKSKKAPTPPRSPRPQRQPEQEQVTTVERGCTPSYKKPKVATISGKSLHELTRIMDSMVGSGNRYLATDAILLYEKMRSQGQHSELRQSLNCCKQTLPEVFGQLVQCAGRAGRPDLIQPLLDDMASAGVERSLNLYEGVMKMLASKKLYKEAMLVCSRLEADKLAPSPVTLSCLITFAVEIGEFDKAVAFFGQLAAITTPSIRASMTILRVHSKRQDWGNSLSLIRDLQTRQAPIDCLVLNIVLATGVAAGQLHAAKKLLDEFSNIADVISYNTVMKGFAQQKDADRAMKLLNEMYETSVKPNTITFNTVMDAAVRSSRITDAWRMLAKMRDDGLSPDKFTCTTLLKGLQEGATASQLSVILDLLQHVTAECDPPLCSFLFRSVIEATVRLNDPALKARAVAQMRERRSLLPAHEYQRLVQLVTRERATCAGRLVSQRAVDEVMRPVSVY